MTNENVARDQVIRGQVIRDQMTRDQVIRDQVIRDQMTRGKTTRVKMAHTNINREEIDRDKRTRFKTSHENRNREESRTVKSPGTNMTRDKMVRAKKLKEKMRAEFVLGLKNKIMLRNRMIALLVLIVIFLVVMLVIQLFLISNLESNKLQSTAEVSEKQEVNNAIKDEVIQAKQTTCAEEGMPILVNWENKIPDNYVFDIVDIGNEQRCDRETGSAFIAMNDKAYSENINIWVASSYRDSEKQITLYNEKVKEYQGKGYSYEEACEAVTTIAVPGTGEHELGLALDINIVKTSFEHTKEYDWLIENCADFGFILRYPKDKVELTNIDYEPWHYRYVGEYHAKIIMEHKICLEEYINGDY